MFDFNSYHQKLFRDAKKLSCLGLRYLTYHRGIDIAVLESVTTFRFAPRCYNSDTKAYHPALLVLVCNPLGNECDAVQRIYLNQDGAKLTGKAKKLIGGAKGNVFYAKRKTSKGGSLIITEGVEDCLTAKQHWGANNAYWAAISAGNLPNIDIPSSYNFSSIKIVVDNDDAGIKNSELAAAKWHEQGHKVEFINLPVGKDLNALHLEQIIKEIKK